jgi:hypothetical protein
LRRREALRKMLQEAMKKGKEAGKNPGRYGQINGGNRK